MYWVTIWLSALQEIFFSCCWFLFSRTKIEIYKNLILPFAFERLFYNWRPANIRVVINWLIYGLFNDSLSNADYKPVWSKKKGRFVYNEVEKTWEEPFIAYFVLPSPGLFGCFRQWITLRCRRCLVRGLKSRTVGWEAGVLLNCRYFQWAVRTGKDCKEVTVDIAK